MSKLIKLEKRNSFKRHQARAPERERINRLSRAPVLAYIIALVTAAQSIYKSKHRYGRQDYGIVTHQK